MRQIKRLLPVVLVFAIALCTVVAFACSKKYTVTFDADGGTEIASQTVKKGQTATKPEDPAKENYEFDGWFLGEDEYDFDTQVKSNITLKAQWTRLYKVTFDTDGGSAAPEVQTVRDGGTATQPSAPTKTGYGFGGWTLNDTVYSFSTAVTSDITLKAVWNLNEYTVTFDTDGGSAIAAVKVNHGQKVTKPEDPTKTGYTLSGWFNGETEYNFTETTVTSDITLTAKWTLNEYTVTFDTDGGSEIADVKVNHGEKITVTAPTKAEYVFTGWYLNDTLFNLNTEVTGNMALKAHWAKGQLGGLSIDVENVKKSYTVGESINTDGIVVTAELVSENKVAGTFVIASDDVNLVIDSSEYDNTKTGTYTVYVSYTLDGITRHASYEVTVESVIGGVHGIEIVKETVEYDIAVGDAEPVVVPVNDIKVYRANEDGTRGAELAATEYTLKYYIGNREIELSEMTNQNARVFQIWASAVYTEGTETYEMSDFVLVRINGNNIVDMQFVSEGATTSQAQGYTDGMSNTWKFNVEYRLGQTAVIDLSTAEIGTGDNQYTLENFSPAFVGESVAKLTYHYAVGTEIWEYTAEVPYSVTPVTADTAFRQVIDVNVGTDDGYKDNATAVISKGLSEGDEVVPLMVYVAKGSGLATNSENKTDTEGKNKLYGRVQFASARGLQLYIAGPATITLKARYGSSSGAGGKFQLKQGEKVIAESANIANSKQYETVTIKVTEAGIYDLFATASLNTFAIEIEGKILAPKASTNLTDVEAKAYAANVNAELGSATFTLMGGGSVAVEELKDADGTPTPVTVAGVEFDKIIKLGGSKSNKNTQRTIKIEVTEDMVKNGSVTVLAYAVSGSTSAERFLTLYTGNNGATEVSRNGVSTAALLTYTIKEAGTYYLGSAGSGINVYGVSLVYDDTVQTAPDGGNE